MHLKSGLAILALAVAASGGVLAGSVNIAHAEEIPPQPVTETFPTASPEQSSAPLFVTASNSIFSNASGIVTWQEPVGNEVRQVLAYQVSLTPEGEPARQRVVNAVPAPLPQFGDRTAFEGYAQLPDLKANTKYNVEVKALIVSNTTGERLETIVGATTLKTGTFLAD